MTLMKIRREMGRTPDFPQGDSRHAYEFIAPLDQRGHLDAGMWRQEKSRCTVRRLRPGESPRLGMLRHVGQGWRFDYVPGSSEDDEPFFKLDRHVISPGLYVTITEEDGAQRPFRVVSVAPAGIAA